MRLYVEPMDRTVVEVSPEGRILLEHEDWCVPTLQERRAILFAAEQEIAELQELVDLLSRE